MADDLRLLRDTIKAQLGAIENLSSKRDELEYYLCAVLLLFDADGHLEYPEVLQKRVLKIRKLLGHSGPHDAATSKAEILKRIQLQADARNVEEVESNV